MRSKRGMTLAETLLVFVIMGIVASLTIVSVKPWEKNYKQIYSRIYNALSVTIYNDMVDTGKFPETSVDFCETLLKYMNTSDNADPENICKNENDITSKPDFSSPSKQYYPFKDAAGGIQPGKGIHLSNGSFIWFAGNSEHKPFKYELTGDSAVNFYLVFADLNGDAAPNSAQYTNQKRPDIVAFAVTDKFSVVPLGYPTIDMKYLQAHFTYPAENEEDEDIISDPMAFRAAQILAFGTGTPEESSCPFEDTTNCETIKSTSNPMTLELQETPDLDWTNDDHSCKITAGTETSVIPFCMNWNGTTAKNAVLRILVTKDSEGNTIKQKLKTKDMNIFESCKTMNTGVEGYSEPICDIKIYDYH